MTTINSSSLYAPQNTPVASPAAVSAVVSSGSGSGSAFGAAYNLNISNAANFNGTVTATAYNGTNLNDVSNGSGGGFSATTYNASIKAYANFTTITPPQSNTGNAGNATATPNGPALPAQPATNANTSAAPNATVVPAQPVTSTPATNSTASSGNGSSGSGAAAAGGGGVPVSGTSTSSTEVQELIQEATAKAAVQIGFAQAPYVVDSQGNIEYAQLRYFATQQANQEAVQKQAVNSPASTTANTNIQPIDLVA